MPINIPNEISNKIAQSEETKHPGAICIANYKGGVGKTTMTCLIGYYLAKMGKKVLLIDIDAQCSLTLAVGYDLNKLEKPDFTIHNLVLPSKWTAIRKTPINEYVFDIPDIYAPNSLKIIRGAFDVDELDIKIAQTILKTERSLYELFTYCRQLIYSFEKEFDYILVDCPPNKMYLTQAMLRACPYFITVTIPDKISVFGVPRLKKWIHGIEEEVRPKMLGCILNGVNRSGGYETGTKNQQQAESTLKRSIEKVIYDKEYEVIGSAPVLAHIPKLDVISKFLSEDDEKVSRFDFSNQPSDQPSVNTILINLVNRIQHRIDKYAKA
jgi:cellulose biosynthesis protein BcsQ